MSKKSFVVILVLSVVVTWLTKELMGILKFSLGGLKAGLPLNFYQCTFISSCDTIFLFLIADIVFWFFVIWVVWKLITRHSKR